MSTHAIVNRHTVLQVITPLMILLLAYTGVSKLIDQQTFFQQLLKSRTIEPYAKWIIWLVPISELITALSLLFVKTRLVGYYAFTLLMACFTIYIIMVLTSNETLPCSCGGIIQQMSWKQHLVFNCSFILVGVIAAFLHHKRQKR